LLGLEYAIAPAFDARGLSSLCKALERIVLPKSPKRGGKLQL
jgi:hypothetical protein